MSGGGFQIGHCESFPLELGRAPNKVRNAYSKTVLPLLKERPDRADSNGQIKRLGSYKDLWRLRVSDEYRLVYHLDPKRREVTILMLDHRGKIYERLGIKIEKPPSTPLRGPAEKFLVREAPPEPYSPLQALTEEQPQATAPDNALPCALSSALLEGWGVPIEYHEVLAPVGTEGELIALPPRIPSSVLERVLNGLWPPSIQAAIQQPVRVAMQSEDLEAAATGEQSLESFLLRLDDDQKAFVARFEGKRPSGPWLLKGGPGSGKSTVALYCIRELIRSADAELDLDAKPLRILLTTFTRSLVNASRHLSRSLGVEGSKHRIDIRTVDSLAYAGLPDDWRSMPIEKNPVLVMRSAIAARKQVDPSLTFLPTDAEFLLDEIDWVLIGQNVESLDRYLEIDREGRGRGLTREQREKVWGVFEELKKRLRDAGTCLFSERLQEAARAVKPAYDYVFIDEAQDLKPVAIRFCVGLCQQPSGVFLTADGNQSIYGGKLSWNRVADELRFQGRARILRRNYRTTVEIWRAIGEFAPQGSDSDRETLDIEAVYSGRKPLLAYRESWDEIGARLNAFLHDALIQERVAPGGAAILCPTNRDLQSVVRVLNPGLNARAMNAGEVDLAHPGVKVLTMHAAKGLQFPVVAVVGVEEGRLPLPVPVGMDADEHLARQRRLLFVACSRAMRRLVVFAAGTRRSPFVAGLSAGNWDIEGAP